MELPHHIRQRSVTVFPTQTTVPHHVRHSSVTLPASGIHRRSPTPRLSPLATSPACGGSSGLPCGHALCPNCRSLQAEGQSPKSSETSPLICGINIRSRMCDLGCHYVAKGYRFLQAMPGLKARVRKFRHTFIKVKVDDNIRPETQQKWKYALIYGILAWIMIFGAWRVLVAARYRTPLETLERKPVKSWTVEDVKTWGRYSLGMNWDRAMEDAVNTRGMDGTQLLSLTKQQIIWGLNGISESTRSSLETVVQRIQRRGFHLQKPTSFWQYKSAELGRTMTLAFSLRWFPRLTILYMYCWDYEHSFVPLVQASSFGGSQSNTGKDELSLTQLWVFFHKWVIFPYVPLAQFVWNSSESWSWLSYVVTWECIVFALEEISFLWVIFTTYRKSRSTHGLFATNDTSCWVVFKSWWTVMRTELLVYHVILAVGYLVWPLVPTLLCNMYIYFLLYVNPFILAFLLGMLVLKWQGGLTSDFIATVLKENVKSDFPMTPAANSYNTYCTSEEMCRVTAIQIS